MLPRPFRITASTPETADVVTLELRADDDGPPMAFAPGQFVMAYVFAVGEVPLSISGDPASPERLVLTVRGVGAISRALAAARPGDLVGVRGPFGVGWPLEQAVGRDLLLVAGGLGLAPLRPVLDVVMHRRDAFGRIRLRVGARTPADVPFAAALDTLGRAAPGDERPAASSRTAGESPRQERERDIDVAVTVDAGPADWTGPVGVVTSLLARTELDPGRTVAFVCGPELMMRLVARDLAERGVDPGRVHLSLERTMSCAVGHCGRCQFGARFVCRDGPVLPWSGLAASLRVAEL